MNWRAYFTLLQPKPLLLALAIIPPWLLMLHFLLRLPFGEQKPVIAAFAWWAVMLPLGLGGILTQIIHAPMHRPFSVWLPDARRRLAVWQAGVVGCGLLLCTAMACFLDRTLPFFPVAGIAAAGFTLFLPWNNATKGARAAANVTLILGVSLSAIIFPDVLHAAALAHPWLSGFAGWGIALACFSGGFARSRYRDRVRALNTSPFSITFPSSFYAKASSPRKNPAPWTVTPSDGSLLAWLQVIRYERAGKLLAVGFKEAMLVCGVIGAVIFVDALRHSELFGHALYNVVWPSQNPHFPIFAFVLLSTTGRVLGFQRPSFTYPISRTQQAKVVYLDSLISYVALSLLVILTFLLTAWLIASRLGWPTPMIGAIRFCLLIAWLGPFMALSEWAGVQRLFGGDWVMSALFRMFSLMLGMVTQEVLLHLPRFLVSPGGVALCFLLIGASQYAFYAALRRFYREGDLLQRGTKRQNLSLA